MKRSILPIVVTVVCTVALGIIGALYGATVGGNLPDPSAFTYRGLPGYEGAGLLGLHLGLLVGFLLGAGFTAYHRRGKASPTVR